MITSGPAWLSRNQLVISGLTLSLLLTAIVVILAGAPEEGADNDGARIAYLYFSVGWCAWGAFCMMGIVGAVYLVRRNLSWDHWSQATAETGWLCCTLTLITGVMWSHEAANSWWSGEPRLIVALVMWMMYGGARRAW